jgi:FkbM family methyltransferase
MRSTAQAILLWYARNVPYHRGKQRLSERMRRIFDVSLEGEYIERRGGLLWAINPGDYIQQDLFWSSAKDAADIREALRCMPKGGVMFDLGANFGFYAITIATALRGDCRIYAFEPNPPTMRRFRKNLELNSISGVHPREEGLSDATGHAFVVDQPAHSGAAYLDQALNSANGIPAGIHLTTHVTTLDLFCEQQKIDRLDLIKLDIEGAELRSLRGGVETLRRFQPVLLIELNPDTLERDGCSVRDVVVFLEDLGYAIYTVRPRTRITLEHLPAPRAIVNAVCKAV